MTQNNTMEDAMVQIFNKATNNMVEKIVNYHDKSLMQWVIDYVPIKGYMFNNNPQLKIISELVDEDGHSGASFACCLHNARKQIIALKP